MGELKKFVTPLHESTKRDHLARMMDAKIDCMKIAKEYGYDYWDGDRRHGYGGYKYIPGRWQPVAKALIDTYSLGPGSKIFDIGCGKGFLLQELLLLEPKLIIKGCDISKYGIECAPDSIKDNLFIQSANSRFNFCDKEFDLVISIGALHNLILPELEIALEEIQRLGKNAYIMVESYRDEEELFNLQCWALTCQSFLCLEEWLWVYKNFGYTGDYEFIYFK
jgi:SAM-dependent methyltransferase